ncbi:MAG: peptidoglycan DD-metalloendopeptidase family protein [Hyphomicrobiaceae bacterium]|nr:peptidoglycan DD-metalloendopeptidase family protein [Hyphomicrobiaceae bacterium]
MTAAEAQRRFATPGTARCAVAALAAATAILASGAEPLAQVGPDEATRALDKKRNELKATETRAKSLELDVKALDEERRKINERLVETAALIQSSEARMTSIEARLGELEAQEKLLRGSLNQRHGQISKLLSALLRMGRNPPPVMITQREDALKMVRSAMLLAAAFPELRGQALALVERLNELVRVMTDVRSESERLRTETQRLADARTRLAGLMETKKQSLGERQAELEKVRAAAQEISKNVSDLGELIAKLDQAVSRNTGLASYEEETRREREASSAASQEAAAVATKEVATTPADLVATAPPPAAALTPPTKETEVALLTPPPKPSPRVVELAPAALSGAIPRDPGRIKPAIPFEQTKDRLPLPAQGRRVLSFGEKTNYGGQSKGMVLETRHGAQITSPTDGWIVYAGEFRSYGQLLIINAGGGYHILLAGLSQIDVQPGQFVLAAEPVGTMGVASKGSPASASQAAPVLYVEFRKDGRPIDPDPWWVEEARKVQNFGQQKVQG